MNDLPDYVNNALLPLFADQTLLSVYADDINVVAGDKNFDKLINICSQALEVINSWSSENGLKLNAAKTGCIMFHPPTAPPNFIPELFIEDVKIENLNVATFLGLRVNSTLNWGDQLNHVCNKTMKGIFVLGSLRDNVSINVLKVVYHAHIVSHLRNLILFWGHSTEAQRAFILQKRAIRTIYKVNRLTSCVPLFQKLQVLTLPCIYIVECSVFVKNHSNLFSKNSDFHSHNTRSCSNFRNLSHTKAMFAKSPQYRFIQIFNALPVHIKKIDNIVLFKSELKKYLLTKNYYSISDFLNPCT